MKKTALITGSSRGIGKAIAYEFAKNGYKIIINSNLNQSQLLETYNEFTNKGFECDYIKADVSNFKEVEDMVNQIYKTNEKIDIIVNNAGISHIGLLTDMTVNNWNNVINTNLNSVFNCCKLIVPKMIHFKDGCIINISSIWGIKGASCEVAYSASKGAINSFTKALAKELGPSNIRVNAIACGVIETKMNDWLDEEEKNILKEEIPLMHFGKAKDIAKLALFLASENSNFITGQIITADGGMI